MDCSISLGKESLLVNEGMALELPVALFGLRKFLGFAIFANGTNSQGEIALMEIFHGRMNGPLECPHHMQIM